MITDYSQFDYNQTFLYNYNIFNNSKNIGIGTNTPSHILEVHNNIYTKYHSHLEGNNAVCCVKVFGREPIYSDSIKIEKKGRK